MSSALAKDWKLKINNVINIIKNSHEISDFDYVETQSERKENPSFSVTLGIMPDYLSEEIGLRIDGVSKGKLSSRIGILKGDIILKMGNVTVTDIMTYMEALSKFKSGDSTTVKVKRNSKNIIFNVTFD